LAHVLEKRNHLGINDRSDFASKVGSFILDALLVKASTLDCLSEGYGNDVRILNCAAMVLQVHRYHASLPKLLVSPDDDLFNLPDQNDIPAWL
jgi:hypothetical protein